MEKCVIASIGPEWSHKILTGIKFYEVRKTAPSLPLPFRCLIYCTKPKVRMIVEHIDYFLDELYRLPTGEIQYGCSVELAAYSSGWDANNFLNGKIVGEFVCDGIVEYPYTEIEDFTWGYKIPTAVGELTGMEYEQLHSYGAGKNLYLWHISNLKIYDKPLALADVGISSAPQSWRYLNMEDHDGN